MSAITREQREAIKRIYDRTPLYVWQDKLVGQPKYKSHEPLTYRQFRKRAIPLHSFGCVMIQWCGMWLGIEADGYTHS